MKIADGIYSIGQTGKMAYLSGYSHAYLLDDGRELTLIDTLADGDACLIFEELQKIKRPVSDLKYILLTHGHMSHLGGLATLKRASGAIVCSHAWEADIIAGNRTIQTVPMWPTPPLRLLPQRMGLALGVSAAPACPVDRHLKEGEHIGPVRVIHTPGHTPGHLAFYWPARQALFTGDKVVTWPRFEAGWPKFNLNEKQFQHSFLRMVVEVYPHIEILGVSHGEPVIREAADRVRSLIAGLSM